MKRDHSLWHWVRAASASFANGIMQDSKHSAPIDLPLPHMSVSWAVHHINWTLPNARTCAEIEFKENLDLYDLVAKANHRREAYYWIPCMVLQIPAQHIGHHIECQHGIVWALPLGHHVPLVSIHHTVCCFPLGAIWSTIDGTANSTIIWYNIWYHIRRPLVGHQAVKDMFLIMLAC